VPDAKVTLLSVQQYCTKVHNGCSFVIDSDGCIFLFPCSDGGGKITFDLENGNMLLQTSVTKQWGRKLMPSAQETRPNVFTVVSTDNLNLNSAQKSLLEWHWKLEHFNMNWIRYLIRRQIIWQPRSKVGQFLGRSRLHASSMGLIKNVESGFVSSQFHVVYDDHFTTLSVNNDPEGIDLPKEWVDLFTYSREKHFNDNDANTHENKIGDIMKAPAPQTDVMPSTDISTNPSADSDTGNVPEPISSPASQPGEQTQTEDLPLPPTLPPSTCHSRQIRNLEPENTGLPLYLEHDEKYMNFLHDFNAISHHDLFLLRSDLNTVSNSLTRQYDFLHLLMKDDFDDDIQHGFHPCAFGAKANAEDNPTLDEAMSGPDREGFLKFSKSPKILISLFCQLWVTLRGMVDHNTHLLYKILK
jgi:hypothetical protein